MTNWTVIILSRAATCKIHAVRWSKRKSKKRFQDAKWHRVWDRGDETLGIAAGFMNPTFLFSPVPAAHCEPSRPVLDWRSSLWAECVSAKLKPLLARSSRRWLLYLSTVQQVNNSAKNRPFFRPKSTWRMNKMVSICASTATTFSFYYFSILISVWDFTRFFLFILN